MLDGNWIPESGDMSGLPLGPEMMSMFGAGRLTLVAERYSANFGGIVDQGVCRFDVSGETADLDIHGEVGPNAGRVMYCLHRLNGDALEVCYRLDGGARPTEFSTRVNEPELLLRFRRAAASD